jgi:hypothetical protein
LVRELAAVAAVTVEEIFMPVHTVGLTRTDWAKGATGLGLVAVMIGEIPMPGLTQTDWAKGAIRLGLVAVAVMVCLMPVHTVGLTPTGSARKSGRIKGAGRLGLAVAGLVMLRLSRSGNAPLKLGGIAGGTRRPSEMSADFIKLSK